MRIVSFHLLYLSLTCAILCTACGNKKPVKPEKPVKPITEVPTTISHAETISDIKVFEPAAKKRAVEEKAENSNRRVPLTVVVENLVSPNAPVEMSIYGPNNKFLDSSDNLDKIRVKPQNGKLVAKINNLSYGDLAIALYQDVNSDGHIDKNLIGIPQEPYAFSNNYKPVIKAPSFGDCKFLYSSKTNTINVTLIK